MGNITRYFLNGAAGAGGEQPWLAYNQGGYEMDSVAVSADYVYQTGWTSGSTFSVVQFDHDGNVNWQRDVNLGATNQRTYAQVDSSQNCIVVCAYDAFITSISPSGTINWSRGLGRSFSSSGVDSFKWDAANNRGYLNYAGTGGFEMVYFTGSPPTVQFARYLGTSGACGGIDYDTSGNSYSVATWNGTPDRVVVRKHDTSGNLSWSKTFEASGVSGDVRPYSCAWSDNGTLFIGVQHNNDKPILMWNNASSGNMTYRYRYAIPNGNAYPLLRMDNDENRLYCAWPAADQKVYFTKHTSSGSLQWQNVLSGTSNLASNENGFAQYGDFVYFSAKAINFGNSVLLKVPKDGSGQGTYGSFTYATDTSTYGSNTSGNIALNSTTWSASSATRTWSNQSASASSASGTITLYEKS